MLPPAKAETSGTPRPDCAGTVPAAIVVGASPKAVWYHGTGCVVSTPPELVLFWTYELPSLPLPPTKVWLLVTAYSFHTVSTSQAPLAEALGRLVRPPAMSCQIVCRSPAMAWATTVFTNVGSLAAIDMVDSDEPPTRML